jgi:hypothetical protein
MKNKNFRYHKSIPDLNAYEKSYKLGMSLALSKKPLDFKLNPYSRIFRPASHLSFALGLKLSYQKGLEIRENSLAYDQLKVERRKRELKELGTQKKISRFKERER